MFDQINYRENTPTFFMLIKRSKLHSSHAGSLCLTLLFSLSLETRQLQCQHKQRLPQQKFWEKFKIIQSDIKIKTTKWLQLSLTRSYSEMQNVIRTFDIHKNLSTILSGGLGSGHSNWETLKTFTPARLDFTGLWSTAVVKHVVSSHHISIYSSQPL